MALLPALPSQPVASHCGLCRDNSCASNRTLDSEAHSLARTPFLSRYSTCAHALHTRAYSSSAHLGPLPQPTADSQPMGPPINRAGGRGGGGAARASGQPIALAHPSPPPPSPSPGWSKSEGHGVATVDPTAVPASLRDYATLGEWGRAVFGPASCCPWPLPAVAKKGPLT